MAETKRPQPGEFYRHFKDKLYQIIAVAEHTETQEELVIYQALYGKFKIYARPLSMFLSEVDREKYPQAEQLYRFERVMPSEDFKQPFVSEEKTQERPHTLPVLPSEITPESKTQKLLEFLDADTCAQKLELLRKMKAYIDEKMLHDIAVVLDIAVEEGSLENGIRSIESSLEMRKRFECNRLR